MKETAERLAYESQVDNALDVADKNREKAKKSGKSHFENDGMQKHLVFQLAFKYPQMHSS